MAAPEEMLAAGLEARLSKQPAWVQNLVRSLQRFEDGIAGVTSAPDSPDATMFVRLPDGRRLDLPPDAVVLAAVDGCELKLVVVNEELRVSSDFDPIMVSPADRYEVHVGADTRPGR